MMTDARSRRNANFEQCGFVCEWFENEEFRRECCEAMIIQLVRWKLESADVIGRVEINLVIERVEKFLLRKM